MATLGPAQERWHHRGYGVTDDGQCGLPEIVRGFTYVRVFDLDADRVGDSMTRHA